MDAKQTTANHGGIPSCTGIASVDALTTSNQTHGIDENASDLDCWQPATRRDVSAILNPRPLALVGACGPDDETCFATVAWIMPVSHNPAMVAFALRAKSRTMELLRTSGAFSICTLPANAAGISSAEICGNRSGHRENKAELISHFMVNAAAEQDARTSVPSPAPVPIAELAPSWMTCAVERIEETGDHLLVVGNVLTARTRCSRDDRGRLAPADTLLCVQHDTFASGTPL